MSNKKLKNITKEISNNVNDNKNKDKDIVKKLFEERKKDGFKISDKDLEDNYVCKINDNVNNKENEGNKNEEDKKEDINENTNKNVILVKDKIDEQYQPRYLTKEEREQYAEENIMLVYKVVHSTFRYTDEVNYSFEDLAAEGMKGFTKALNTFDINKGFAFSTYAWRCIRNRITYYLRGENEHRLRNQSMETELSSDGAGNTLELEDVISTLDHGDISVDEKVIISESIEFMNELIKELSYNEQYIITYRYGLNNQKIKTQKEIADEIGMSQANVSKLEKSIVEKLHRLLSSRYKLRNLDDI